MNFEMGQPLYTKPIPRVEFEGLPVLSGLLSQRRKRYVSKNTPAVALLKHQGTARIMSSIRVMANHDASQSTRVKSRRVEAKIGIPG